MEIYVLINEETHGPYTPEQVRGLIKTGELQATQLAAYAGSPDWIPLSTMMRSSGAAASRPIPSGKKKALIPVFIVLTIMFAGGIGFLLWKRGRHVDSPIATTPVDPSLPKTLAELNQWYAEPPAGQNAATFYQQGFDLLRITNYWGSVDLPIIGRGILPPLGTPLSPKAKAAIAAFLLGNKRAHEAIQQGANYEQCRYPADLNLGINVRFPHLIKIQQVAQTEQLAAIHFAGNKQTKEATDAILLSLAVAQSVAQEPMIISQLLRARSATFAINALEASLNLATFSATDLDRLGAALAKLEADESSGKGFSRAAAGERVSVQPLFDPSTGLLQEFLKLMLDLSEVTGFEGKEELRLGVESGMLTNHLNLQRAFIEETFNEALALRKQPFPERLKVNNLFKDRAAEAKIKEFYLCAMMLPAHGTAIGREARLLAHFRLAQVAVALECFRAANNNRYPTALSELSSQFLPSVPADPFNGQPLRYRNTTTGYQMYSVGMDLQDDNGKRTGNRDWVFEVIKAPPTR